MIKAAVKGVRQLQAANRRLEQRTKQATKRRVGRFTDAVKGKARQDVKRIFRKNNKIANSIRAKKYDNRGAGDAGQIYDKFGKKVRGKFISNLEPYLTGRPIKPTRGRFMAIWRGRGKRKTPDQFKNLVAVRTMGGLWLVRSTKSKTTFLFELVKVVRVRKRLRPERYLRRAAREMPRQVQRDIEASV